MGNRLNSRAVIGALLAVAAVVAIVAPGGASGGDDASQPYPTRQISIMAPAAPGGGWDTTARAFQAASRDAKLDDGVEVFNVEGAGGTLGLSQLVSKSSGDPYQLMMTGLVMLGAIETNGSDVALDRTTPIATMITETEGIVVPANSKYQSLKDLTDDFKRDPASIRWAGGSAGSTDQLLVGELARVLGADPAKTKYVAHSGGGEANAAILSGSVDAGVSGLSEFVEQIEGGKMRLLAVSSPVDIEIDGRKPPTIKDEGIDLEMTNWRAITGPPGLSDGERERIAGWVSRVLKTPQWQKNVERYDWTPFVKTGAELDDFVASEQKRVQEIVADLGLGEVIGARASAASCWRSASSRSWRRSASATAGRRAGRGSRRRSPSVLLIALAALFLARPGEELADHIAEASEGTHWPTPALLLGLLIGYALLLGALGYALATTIFFWLAAWLLGSEKPARDLLIGVVIGVVTSFVFSELLNVQLPQGPWGV